MAETLTSTRPPSRVAAVILGNPGGHRAEIVEALSRFGFRHTFADTPEAALQQAQGAASSLLVVSASDIQAEPELAANVPGRRAVVVAMPSDDRDGLPESIAAVLGADEASSVEALAETLQSVAREVSYSRRRDTMLRWLERESERDASTGLHTREAFEAHLAKICLAAEASGAAVCAIVVDLPSVRFVQEAYGREAANDILHRAALAVSRSIRFTDIAGRLSTDTLGIALPGASLDAGRRVARRILQTVEQENTETDTELGISIGFGVASGVGCTSEELLEAAGNRVAHAHRVRTSLRPRAIESDGPSVA
jgi:diguanylate cyclase (GGDEF)-like protein